ncbi:hypothetical protein GS528_28105 [Rhodococcus hoagii]|nr:hypothetical protein [Prescottella equi]
MAPITVHYGITGPVPFLDVDTTVDNKWFVDPHAIRLHGDVDPFAEKANKCTETFFDEVPLHVSWDTAARSAASAAVRGTVGDASWARESGFSGHGGAEDVGSWIWQALNNDIYALIAVGKLKQIEDPLSSSRASTRTSRRTSPRAIIFEAWLTSLPT